MKRNLHLYQQWRKELVPLNNGTVVVWKSSYNGVDIRSSIKSGQSFLILKSRDPLIGRKNCNADLVYDMVLCSKNGIPKSKTMNFSVESIASFLEDGLVEIKS